MKTINIIYLLSLILAIEFSPVHSQAITPNNNGGNGQVINGLKYFVGDWVGLDYTCRKWNEKILEQVNFPDEPDKIYAKKITGDDCVTKGTTTFRFNSYPKQLKYDTDYPVTWTLGNAYRPNFTTGPGSLRLIDNDNFEIEGFRFVRGRLVNDQLVKEYATPTHFLGRNSQK
jgi:hypothetical protein